MTSKSSQCSISPVTFITESILYSIISWYLIVITAGGWFYTINQYLYGIFFIIFIISTVSLYLIKKPQAIKIDLPYLVFVLFIQLIINLLNYGDCGDAGGSYLFIEKYINIESDLCSNNYSLLTIIPIIGFSTYTTLIVYWLYKIFFKINHELPPPPSPSYNNHDCSRRKAIPQNTYSGRTTKP